MVSALARASVEGALLVAAVWVLSRVLRLTPATRTLLWWCAAAKFVVALAWTTPIVLPVLPAEAAITVRSGRVAAARVETVSRATPGVTPARPDLGSPWGSALREWSSFAAIAWGFGLLLVAAVGVRRWRAAVQMLRASAPAPDDVQAHAAELASRLGLRRVPEVRLSARIATPLVTGLVRPVVLLPSERVHELSDRQRQLALCHELTHLKRADLWLGCVPALAERVFFFHPLVHFAAREYALAREAACDAAVMETLDAAPQEYGRLLLSLGVSHPATGFTAAGGAWSFLSLKRRIAMLQDVSTRSPRARALAFVAVGLAIAAMVPVQLGARPAALGKAQRDSSRLLSARPTASSRTSDTPRVAPVDAQVIEPAADEPVERPTPARQVESRQPRDSGMKFVLMLEDNQRTSSGSDDDVKHAERQRKNGEPLLWFRFDGREYVVRDAELLRQARALWNDVYDSDFGRHALGAVSQALEAIDIDQIVKSGIDAAEQATLGAHLGEMVAEQATLAARLGLMAAGQALHGLSDHAAMAGIDEADMQRHRRSLDKAGHELEKNMHSLELEIKGDLDVQMRELHHQLRDLDVPARQLAAPMKEFGQQMKEFGHTIGRATHDATNQMRELIDRAIASGLAEPVK